jgi:hypothetical protein
MDLCSVQGATIIQDEHFYRLGAMASNHQPRPLAGVKIECRVDSTLL